MYTKFGEISLITISHSNRIEQTGSLIIVLCYIQDLILLFSIHIEFTFLDESTKDANTFIKWEFNLVVGINVDTDLHSFSGTAEAPNSDFGAANKYKHQ